MTELSAARTTGGRGFHHTMHSVLQHNQLAFKSNKVDLSNIPVSLKTLILEQSAQKLKEYSASPVYCRSETKYNSFNTKDILQQKKKRIEGVYTRGFCADPKELYRPLGDPILDTEVLLHKGLDIDPSVSERSGYQDDEIFREEIQHKVISKESKQFPEVSKRFPDGFQTIKEKIFKSHHRINSVRFGVPFTSVCDTDIREHVYDKSTETDRNPDQKIDWQNLNIEPDRQAYFTNLHLRNERAAKANEAMDMKKPNEKIESRKSSAKSRKGTLFAAYDSPKGKPVITMKQMETALGIQKSNLTGDTIDKFYGTRNDFYEQRQRLTHMLMDDLNRLDYERKNNFQRKVKIFELSSKGQCIDDLKAMRKKAFEQSRIEKKTLLNSHPWYTELMNKVVIMNGVRREVTHYESVLLRRLKSLIEDQVKFKKSVFVQLMRVLPTKEFLKDDIQRILRFVKQHENISERDYLEAVELAGHSLS